MAGKKILLGNVYNSIELLKKSKTDYEFRTTFIPGMVEEKEIIKIAEHLNGSKRFVLQQFKPVCGTLDKNFSSLPLIPRETLLEIAEKINGIKEVYIKTASGTELLGAEKKLELIK